MGENYFPVIKAIPYKDPVDIFSHFYNSPWAIFLDSACLDGHLGRFSFIGIDPFLTIVSKNNQVECNGQVITDNPFSILKEKLQEYPMRNVPNYPPFQGGIAGYFAYDLCQHLEKLPRNQDTMGFPDMMVGFYDLIIAIDLYKKESYIFSSGFPLKQFSERSKRAKQRIQYLQEKLQEVPEMNFLSNQDGIVETIHSNFTRQAYEKSIQRTIDYIYAGDIFQANIAQQFSCAIPKNLHPFQLYQRLRQYNPAPFAAFLNYGEVVIASSSPERFLKLTGNKTETRPIKGTRRRGRTPAEDQLFAKELQDSEKNRAENVMIVDLLRNDLSRVCKNETVKVEKLCGLESYATVHHLVSVVTGELDENLGAIDLLKATFPGGSITGAPKVRAMEIIAEIEPTQRGPYCGSIGYIGFNGDMDLSIVIRTYAIKNNKITFHAGGGIVADSNSAQEYEETLIKAQALQRTLTEPIGV